MTLTSSVTGAAIVAQTLQAERVRHVFGIPGGQTLSITDQIYKSSDIHFIATRHEGAAAAAADAYGRVTGRPGVCLATAGPGATNLLTGIGGALRDSSPVIVLTCNNRRKDVGRGDAQEADHVAIFRSITKWSVYADDVRTLAELMREAFRVSLGGRPGPVHVDLARDVLETETTDFTPWQPETYRVNDRLAGDPEAVVRAAQVLSHSRRPAIWVGNGVRIAGAGSQVMALAERLQCPVITTFNTIGIVPSSHPLVVGPRSRSGTQFTDEILSESDVVVVLGSSLSGPDTSRWTLKLPADLIHVDIDYNALGRHYPTKLGIVGDVGKVAQQLLPALVPDPEAAAQRSDRAEGLSARREAWWRDIFKPEFDSAVPVKPQAIMKQLSAFLTQDAIVAVDAGNPGIWSHLLSINPPQMYIKPVNFGNMGFALPAAIAAKLAYPAREVVAVLGDGSLGMTLAELETAVRVRTPITILLMNDMAYGNIKQEQIYHLGPRNIGVDFTDIDFSAIARACRAQGEKVNHPDQLLPALKRARESQAVYLIDVRIDGSDNVWANPF